MHPRITLSVGNFFYAISGTIVAYIILPYLGRYMAQGYASLVVAAGAAVSLACFLYLPRFVERYGAQPLLVALGLTQLLILFALAAHPGPFGAPLFIALLLAVQPFLSYTLDLLLEATVAKEGTTGQVRTIFLTAGNIAAVGTPLLMGALLDNTDAYARIFLAAAAASVPFILLFAMYKLPAGKPPLSIRFTEALRSIVKRRDLLATSTSRLLLYMFYVWAPFYVPVYLHNILGISWSELGWMFSAMLIPFVLVEYPAGWIADNFLGDQELMLLGFIIMGGSFASLVFVTSASSAFFIAALLFLTRFGAALVESMTEAHFFRRVSEEDTEEIAAYRMLWPLADLIAPVAGAIILFIDGFSGFFIVTGVFLLVTGSAAALSIRDFR